MEWTNAGTLGGLPVWDKLVTGVEAGVMPRTAGFNSFDWGSVRPETLGLGTVLMFIGGGSASTAGGIKVTTFLLLAYVILAEVRGDPDVVVGKRSIGYAYASPGTHHRVARGDVRRGIDPRACWR
ncbi:MAG: potassium transporter TrkG [Nocardioidaceae bacterium]